MTKEQNSRYFVRIAAVNAKLAGHPEPFDVDVLIVWIHHNGQTYAYRFRLMQVLTVIRCIHRDVSQGKYPRELSLLAIQEIHETVSRNRK